MDWHNLTPPSISIDIFKCNFIFSQRI